MRRIWDVLLYEGHYILYTFMYALLKINSSINLILSNNIERFISLEFSQMMSFWGEIGETVGDPDSFMSYSYKYELSEKFIEEIGETFPTHDN